MFNNIGGKIKVLAKVLCIIGVVLSAVLGIVFICERLPLVGMLIVIIGAPLSWVASFFTYGFGQLIESTDTNKEYLREIRDMNFYGNNTNNNRTDANHSVSPDNTHVTKAASAPHPAPHQANSKIGSSPSYESNSENESQNNADSFDVYCPYCGESLYFTKDQVKDGCADCPFCWGSIKLF
ncbi:MAG: hypothetical protein J6L81_09060 [Clostridia bacterium]|nr:hypothetical protein [Clostridia bacterium]